MEVKKLLNDKVVYKNVNFDNGYLIIGYLTVYTLLAFYSRFYNTFYNTFLEFYNRLMKSFLQKIEICSMYNEAYYLFFSERFIRALKNKIHKYMTSTLKKLCIDNLDDTMNKYNDTYHSRIKMKPVDVESSTYIDSSRETNEKVPNW